jgi:transglutaminase-like putative cysteine protease
LYISPEPFSRHERIDFFGNRLTLFTIRDPHCELIVEARSEVTVTVTEPHRQWADASIPWEQAAGPALAESGAQGLDAYQFVFESPRIPLSDTFAAYARKSFARRRPFGGALLELTRRIHREFMFDKDATTVRTTPEDVLRKKKGVCQDFAHLEIACLRSIGVPARYVSGYLRTSMPGCDRAVGADVSHAWVAAYCTGAGWLEVDPTNNLIPSEGHVTLAWGRDYGDISPLRGVIVGGRDHILQVNVDMQPND